jgi:putative membrane protein
MEGLKRSHMVAVGVLFAIALGLSVLTGDMMGPGMMGPEAMSGAGRMWGLGGLTMLIFWGAVIVGIVLLVRFLGASDSTFLERSSLDVAKRRYAAGEITREQYDEIRKTLEER